MAIYIYNSLSREKEEFKPIKKNQVKMYVCGPTVYDESHIGHARGAFVFDVIKNYLGYKGFKVTYVRNVTDVDDKIIDKAKKLNEDKVENLRGAVKEVADRYLEKYTEDMKALGIGKPDVEPKATEHIKDMLRIIRVLLKKGYAYEADGDIYFRVKSFKNYGELSHQSLGMMESGARVSPEEKKEDPLDFALWKKSKEGEPSWKSGSIEGRPGWHIECSAMSMKHLGENFDIHGGGIDLIFPHHENEIAQSESYSEKNFANYWMHNGLLTINGQKMAKSLGNYLTISDFLDKYKDPDILKLFLLSAHYRNPIDFTEENITAAKAAKERFVRFLDKAEEFISKSYIGKLDGGQRRKLAEDILRKPEIYLPEFLKQDKYPDLPLSVRSYISEDTFIQAMDDDFNTPLALSHLFICVSFGNGVIDARGEAKAKDLKVISLDESAGFLLVLAYKIKKLGAVLGLTFGRESISDKFMESIEEKIKDREEARKNRNYGLADKIRKELSEQGVILEDTKDGTKWRLK